MRTWRRSFSASVIRYTQPTALGSRNRLRCAELLSTSEKEKARQFENENVTLKGFIRSVRKQKRFAFAEISDGSTVKSLQAILTPDQAAEYVDSNTQ
jgi:asparaginyl-tRNA synthetase